MFCTQNCVMHKWVPWHHHGQIVYNELKVMQTEMLAFQKVSTKLRNARFTS